MWTRRSFTAASLAALAARVNPGLALGLDSECIVERAADQCARVLGIDSGDIRTIASLYFDGPGGSSQFMHFWRQERQIKTICHCGCTTEGSLRADAPSSFVMFCSDCDIPVFVCWRAIPPGVWGTVRLTLDEESATTYLSECEEYGVFGRTALEYYRATSRILAASQR